MMAKQPEDRFACYDDLVAAIQSVPLDGAGEAPGVTFAPVSEFARDIQPDYGYDMRPGSGNQRSRSNGSAAAEIGLEPLDDLVADEPPELVPQLASTRHSNHERPPVNRQTTDESEEPESVVTNFSRMETATPPRPAIRVSAWIIPGVFLCAALIILGIGLVQFMGSSGRSMADATQGDGQVDSPAEMHILTPARANHAGPLAGSPSSSDERKKFPVPVIRKAAVPPVKWVEPPDTDPTEIDPGLPAATLARFLPDWARSTVPDRVDGPSRGRTPAH